MQGPSGTRSLAGLLSCRLALLVGALAVQVALLACFSSPGLAADRIYWGNYSANKISYAKLDGSGGADLSTPGVTPNGPEGVAIDAAAGRIYWIDYIPDLIAFANLDGSGGGGHLNTTGATVSGAYGTAIDPPGGRLYWANSAQPKVSFANLNGSGGEDLNTTGGTITGNPDSVAVDPVGGRVYWTTNTTISFAKVDGSGGGGNLNTTGATVSSPEGVAIDRAAGRVYWANSFANKISFANLNGSGGGDDLNTTGATVNHPTGVAIDAAAGRIYWANDGAVISFANLDGSGGDNLNTTGATTPGQTDFPVLLKAPSGTGAPAITGASAPGSVLSCSPGSWTPDLLEAFLYRAPQSFAYQWSLNGADIADATASSYTPTAVGEYRCTVTASNEAGSASQTSAPHAIADIDAPIFTQASLSPKTWAVDSKGPSETAVVAKRAKKGTTFSYTLSEPARVVFTIEQKLPGRKVGKKCKKPTRSNRRKRKCTRYKRFGRFAQDGGASRNTKKFSGKIGKKKLKPGRYRASLVATDPAGNKSTVKQLGFRVVRR